MGQIVQLEDFANPMTSPAAQLPKIDTREVERKSFDTGYRDGWNDAFAEARTEDSKSRSNISNALQELGFTYFEARQHIMGSFKPLLQAMMESVLPHASRAALIPFVQQEMSKLADMVEPPIKLVCAPENVENLREIVNQNDALPIEVIGEDIFAPSQIQLRYADGFSSVDTEDTIKRIQLAIEAFFASDSGEDQQYA